MNWKPVTEYVEPDWDSGHEYAPMLLWGPLLGAVTVAYHRRRLCWR